MMTSELFEAVHAFESSSTNQISLRPGEIIRLLNRDGPDWWYGRNGAGIEGWFPASYGNLRTPPRAPPPPPPPPVAHPPSPPPARSNSCPQQPDAVEEHTPTARTTSWGAPKASYHDQFAGLEAKSVSNGVPTFESKNGLLDSFVRSEAEYVATLQAFKASFIDVVDKRDTDDRRRIRDHPKLAVTLDLFVSVADCNSELLDGLQRSRPSVGRDYDIRQLVEALARFSQHMRLYAAYVSANVEALDALSKLQPVLSRFLKATPVADSRPLEKILYLPCQRLPEYRQYLVELMTFVLPDHGDFQRLQQAFVKISDGTRFVDKTLREQEVQLELLQLQMMFIGHVDIFAPTRRLLLDGQAWKVRYDTKEQRQEEGLYLHVFNDALICSKQLIGGFFKARSIIQLSECADLIVMHDNPCEIKLVNKTKMLCLRVAEQHWVGTIQAQIERCRQEAASQQPSPRGSVAVQQGQNLPAMQGLKTASLDARAKTVVYMYASESKYLEYLRIALRALVQPLNELARGATLADQSMRAKGLFESKTSTFAQLTEGTVARLRIQNQSKALQTADMGIFIRTFPQLESVTGSVVAQLETQIAAARESPSPGDMLCVGNIFLDLKPLTSTYCSYAGAYEEAIHILNSSTFADYVAHVAGDLVPLTLDQHLKAPFDAMYRYRVQLTALLEHTPPHHRDYNNLKAAVALTEEAVSKMNKTVEDSRQYRRLRAIRDSIMHVGLSHEGLDSLVTIDRRLIKEGLLEKVCRSKNKQFQFWLFNDLLVYAAPRPAGMYQLNRMFKLSEVRVKDSSTDPCAFEILSAEKSFLALAETPTERVAWVDAIKAQLALQGVKEEQEVEAAPLWVQGSQTEECCLCRQPFMFMTRRKHHCRKCGQVVCDKCSPHRVLLPGIHKTQKQRVCNACACGGSIQQLDDMTLREFTGSTRQTFGAARSTSTSQPAFSSTPSADHIDLSSSGPCAVADLHARSSSSSAGVPAVMGQQTRSSSVDASDSILLRGGLRPPEHAVPPRRSSATAGAPSDPIDPTADPTDPFFNGGSTVGDASRRARVPPAPIRPPTPDISRVAIPCSRGAAKTADGSAGSAPNPFDSSPTAAGPNPFDTPTNAAASHFESEFEGSTLPPPPRRAHSMSNPLASSSNPYDVDMSFGPPQASLTLNDLETALKAAASASTQVQRALSPPRVTSPAPAKPAHLPPPPPISSAVSPTPPPPPLVADEAPKRPPNPFAGSSNDLLTEIRKGKQLKSAASHELKSDIRPGSAAVGPAVKKGLLNEIRAGGKNLKKATSRSNSGQEDSHRFASAAANKSGGMLDALSVAIAKRREMLAKMDHGNDSDDSSASGEWSNHT